MLNHEMQNNIWENMIDIIKNDRRGCDNNDHPRVCAIIANEKGQILSRGIHHCKNKASCTHAEEHALEMLYKRISKESIRLSNCIFFTSLEPCTQRKRFKVPCSHRISSLNFKKICIGMMDPNPDIYGRGIGDILENLGKDKVDYAPKSIRNKIQYFPKNRLFIEREIKRFNHRQFGKDIPIFTGIDEELYLIIAHALFKMYDGDKIAWIFPKLPSFKDKHKFHAVWAQGILENRWLKSVDLLLNEEDWKQGIKDAASSCMGDTLIDEFKPINKNLYRGAKEPLIKLYLRPKKANKEKKCDKRPPDIFTGALLIKNDKIEYVIAPAYLKIKNVEISMFLVCKLKYIVSVKLKRRPNRSAVKKLSDQLMSFYGSSTENCRQYDLYKELKKELDKG